MSRDQLACRSRRLLDRLAEPSSAAGLAALLALLVPELAEHAPALVGLALSRARVRRCAVGDRAAGRERVERPPRLTRTRSSALIL